jgi:hypothetical protein
LRLAGPGFAVVEVWVSPNGGVGSFTQRDIQLLLVR